MPPNLLQKWFPTAKAPVILCAPMFMSVNGTLAAEVTKAGGLGTLAVIPHCFTQHDRAIRILHTYCVSDSYQLTSLDTGFVAGAWDFTPNAPTLVDLDKQLSIAKENLASSDHSGDGTLPIGVGFLTFDPTAADFAKTGLPILLKYKPAAIWLFVPQPGSSTHRDIISSIRGAQGDGSGDWKPQILVQVGTVAAAREALDDGADGIVAQGVGK